MISAAGQLRCFSLTVEVWGPVYTNAFSKVYVFVVINNASIDSRPHYRFAAFSTVHAITFDNELHVVT